jgi:hypothetical protein
MLLKLGRGQRGTAASFRSCVSRRVGLGRRESAVCGALESFVGFMPVGLAHEMSVHVH